MITYENISKEIIQCLQKDFQVREPFIYSQMIKATENLCHKSTLKYKPTQEMQASTALLYTQNDSSLKFGLMNGQSLKSTLKYFPNRPLKLKLNLSASESTLIRAFHISHHSTHLLSHFSITNNLLFSASFLSSFTKTIGAGVNFILSPGSSLAFKSSFWWKGKDHYLVLKDLIGRSNEKIFLQFHLLGSFNWSQNVQLFWSIEKNWKDENIVLGLLKQFDDLNKLKVRFDHDASLSITLEHLVNSKISMLVGTRHNLVDSRLNGYSIRFNLKEE